MKYLSKQLIKKIGRIEALKNPVPAASILRDLKPGMAHKNPIIRDRYKFAYYYVSTIDKFNHKFDPKSRDPILHIENDEGPSNTGDFLFIPDPKDPSGKAENFYDKFQDSISSKKGTSRDTYIKGFAIFAAFHEMSHKYYQHAQHMAFQSLITVPYSYALIATTFSLQPAITGAFALAFGKFISSQYKQGIEMDADNLALYKIGAFNDMINKEFDITEEEICDSVKDFFDFEQSDMDDQGIGGPGNIGIFAFGTHPPGKIRSGLVDIHKERNGKHEQQTELSEEEDKSNTQFLM